MNGRHAIDDDVFDEMSRLVSARLCGNCSTEDMRRLEELVRQGVDACDLYLDLVHQWSILRTWAESAASAGPSQGCEAEAPGCGAEDTLIASSSGEPYQERLPAWSTIFVPTVNDGFDDPWQPNGDRAYDTWRLACFVSGGLFLVALMVGLAINLVYGPMRGAKGPVAQVRAVAWISGTSQCQWNAPAAPVSLGGMVGVGRKLSLRSGLLEITYDTGSKVILQGPVEYEVNSANGGFLSLGRLTGRVTKPSAKGFTVGMPTASLTDLGTEFGAVVASSGMVEAVVFSGEVRVVPRTARGDEGPGEVLRKGQAARISVSQGNTAEAQTPGAVAMPKLDVFPAANDNRFVRSVPRVPAEILIDADRHNGSFEEQAEDVALPGNLAELVREGTSKHPPRFWKPTVLLQKDADVAGSTGEQFAVITGRHVVLTTRFDGTPGLPPVRNYAPHTVYVLTADAAGSAGNMTGFAGFDNNENAPVRRDFRVAEPRVFKPIPTLVLNTDHHPEFVGKPITVCFVKNDTSPESRLYIDNVVLRAFPASP